MAVISGPEVSCGLVLLGSLRVWFLGSFSVHGFWAKTHQGQDVSSVSEVNRPEASFLRQFAADQSMMTKTGSGQWTDRQGEGSHDRSGASAPLQTLLPSLHPFLLEVTS